MWFGEVGLGRKKRPALLRDCGGGQTRKSHVHPGPPRVGSYSYQRLSL